MRTVAHFVAVGYDSTPIKDSIRQFPFHKIVLLVGKSSADSDTKRIQRTASLIEKDFKTLAQVDLHVIQEVDIIPVALEIVALISQERHNGYETRINISSSPSNLAVSCYIAGLISRTPINTILYNSRVRTLWGEISPVVNIPLFPIKQLTEYQVAILDKLLEGKANSIDELIYRVKPDLREGPTDEYDIERNRVNWHLTKLKEDNSLFETTRAGKRTEIQLTDIGKAVIIGQNFVGPIKKRGKKRIVSSNKTPSATRRMREKLKAERSKHRD